MKVQGHLYGCKITPCACDPREVAYLEVREHLEELFAERGGTNSDDRTALMIVEMKIIRTLYTMKAVLGWFEGDPRAMLPDLLAFCTLYGFKYTVTHQCILLERE